MTNVVEVSPTVKSVKKERVIDKLDVSEHFYSIQGEGVTTGVPAYFIRLRGCNLMCGGANAELMKSGQATWWCDTEYVWKKGIGVPFYKMVQSWEKDNILEWVKTGRVHLIWTGGEPSIPKHQRCIPAFLNWFNQQYPDAVTYNEIETNGTMYLTDDMFERLQQINCSVKLANSGMRKDKRLVEASLKRIMEHDNYWFKFVISNESDMDEIEQDFIKPLNIPPTRVLMMPGLDKQADFHERTRFCLELAKKHGYIGLRRMHVSAWDQTTGV